MTALSLVRREAAVWDVDRAPDFRGLLGESAWAQLPAAVRARFASHAERTYAGVMTVEASTVGRIIAEACRLIGTPFAPWRGGAVPVSVRVAPAPAGGLIWERTYAFAGRRPIRVASRKLQTADGGLLELVDGGLGMRLALSVARGELVFRSLGYVWRLGPWEVALPAAVTPGEAVMTHRDLGEGRFVFTMRFVHPLAGQIFFQSGVFEDPLP